MNSVDLDQTLLFIKVISYLAHIGLIENSLCQMERKSCCIHGLILRSIKCKKQLHVTKVYQCLFLLQTVDQGSSVYLYWAYIHRLLFARYCTYIHNNIRHRNMCSGYEMQKRNQCGNRYKRGYCCMMNICIRRISDSLKIYLMIKLCSFETKSNVVFISI